MAEQLKSMLTVLWGFTQTGSSDAMSVSSCSQSDALLDSLLPLPFPRKDFILHFGATPQCEPKFS